MRNLYIYSDKRAVTAFLIIGILTALIYFTLFAMLLEILLINYKLAVTISYLSAVLFHFSMNRKITFKSSNGKLTPQVIKYAIMVFVNYIITIVIVEFSTKVLLVSSYLGVLFSVGATVVTGYLISKLWVFRI